MIWSLNSVRFSFPSQDLRIPRVAVRALKLAPSRYHVCVIAESFMLGVVLRCTGTK
jgi:hypothetical protein